MVKRVNITKKQRINIAKKQDFKCANSPDADIPHMNSYECKLWKFGDGKFDEAGYEIDHNIELAVGGTNKEKNLQALCLPCHKVKTKNFLMVPIEYYPTNSNKKLKREYYKGKFPIKVEDNIKREKFHILNICNNPNIINKFSAEDIEKSKNFILQVIDECHANWSESETDSDDDIEYN